MFGAILMIIGLILLLAFLYLWGLAANIPEKKDDDRRTIGGMGQGESDSQQ